MPAKSKQQQKAAGMALAMKKGKMPMSMGKGAAKHMAKGMTMMQLKEFAGTKTKKLPKRVKGKKIAKKGKRSKKFVNKKGKKIYG